MCDRLKAAVDGRIDDQFVIMARTDAHAVEGQQAAIDRAAAYVEAGADMIFAEALTTLEEYRQFTDVIKVPVLANLTEFGKTPLFTTSELAAVGVAMTLYPLSAFRAMSAAALSRKKVRSRHALIRCKHEWSCMTFWITRHTKTSSIPCLKSRV
jgi:methylisocitrate lyase